MAFNKDQMESLADLLLLLGTNYSIICESGKIFGINQTTGKRFLLAEKPNLGVYYRAIDNIKGSYLLATLLEGYYKEQNTSQLNLSQQENEIEAFIYRALKTVGRGRNYSE